MKKFEYLTHVVNYMDLIKFLNVKGSEGWELVSSNEIPPLGGSYYRLIFKREKGA